ncbi:MAG: signal peptide peptidase SppA [Deltaproteobacteria bacterium]|nr:signal peptide peptidase SppA [Deltaproteobacteria bacterium]
MRRRPILWGFLIGSTVFAIFFVLAVLALSAIPESSGSSMLPGDKIAVVKIQDMILDTEDTLENITDYGNDDSIRAIIVRIDSPGGAVGPSQEIYRELWRIRGENDKVIVASLGGTAASGGYYIASAAHRIVANPGTLTGSIGAIMQFMNVQELLEKIGVDPEVVKSGRFKDIGSYDRKMTDDERALLQGVIDDVLSQFVGAVAQGRGMSEDAVRAIADGRIFTGRQAMEAGLVDSLGNFNDAVEVAADLANIQGKPRLVHPREARPDFLDLFLDELIGGAGQKMARELRGTTPVEFPQLHYR